MKYFTFSKTLVLALLIVGRATAQSEQPAANLLALIESVEFELPVDLELNCVLPPGGTTPFIAKLIFKNAPPIQSSDPDFPSENAPPNAVFFNTATGEGVGMQLGKFSYSEKYYGVPGFRIIAEVFFADEKGDELYATALAEAGPTIPPPFPNATFTGQFTFTGGTGRFVGARGRASISAQQLGEKPLPDMPPNIPGSTAMVLCGWIEFQSDK